MKFTLSLMNYASCLQEAFDSNVVARFAYVLQLPNFLLNWPEIV